MTALVAGKVDYMCDQIVAVVPQAQSDTIRILAIAAPNRDGSMPDVPTADESGLPGFSVSAWNALFAPKATPAPIIARLNAAMVAAQDDPPVRKILLGLGSEIPDPADRTPEALTALIQSEIARWTTLLSQTEAVH
jgi:tripartite-type tricarboxylate transporter receptor subunit TctC